MCFNMWFTSIMWDTENVKKIIFEMLISDIMYWLQSREMAKVYTKLAMADNLSII